MMWTIDEAFSYAIAFEQCAKQCGAHVALTGGLLYKDGPRKDLDIVVYRIRQEAFDREKFFKLLALHNVTVVSEHGFVTKTKDWKGRPIDFLYPEHDDDEGSYPHD